MDDSKRNTALMLIGAGVYLAVGHLVGYAVASALVLALLGYAILRSRADGETRLQGVGYVLMAVAVLLAFANHSGLLLLGAAGIAFWHYMLRRKGHSGAGAAYARDAGPGAVMGERWGGEPFGASFIKQHIAASIRWGRAGEAWTARSAHISAAVAEVSIDLTNAVFEEPDIVLNLQGMIGDIDIVVPEDVGLSVDAQAAVGELRIAGERSSGFGNRLVWISPNYECAEHRVQLKVSYAVADVHIKVL